VALPTYAFQRERYWLESSSGAGDLTAVGQSGSAHPLLGAVVELAGGDGWLFTGRLSLHTHPWLADHAVAGTVLFPGTAFVELALHAGEHAGLTRIGELALDAPLVIPRHGSVSLQAALGPRDESGNSSLEIYSRPTDLDDLDEPDRAWTRHVTATLTVAANTPNGHASTLAAHTTTLTQQWPPHDATPLALDDLYEQLAERGFEYGPAFQGLTAAWRHGTDVLAEVSLAADRAATSDYGVHPALLDSALHAGLAAQPPDSPVRLPFAFHGVELHQQTAQALRVLLTSDTDGTITLTTTDQTGVLVATIESLTARELPPEHLQSAHAAHRDSLFDVKWNALPSPPSTGEPSTPRSVAILTQPDSSLAAALTATGSDPQVHGDIASLLAALDTGAEPPHTVLVDLTAPTDPATAEPVSSAHDLAQRALAIAQTCAADGRCSVFVFVTRDAVAVDAQRDVDVAGSVVWGLVRSAMS
jgi:acyl transferase domain-containing protein